jgi:hypothetical protein
LFAAAFYLLIVGAVIRHLINDSRDALVSVIHHFSRNSKSHYQHPVRPNDLASTIKGVLPPALVVLLALLVTGFPQMTFSLGRCCGLILLIIVPSAICLIRKLKE